MNITKANQDKSNLIKFLYYETINYDRPEHTTNVTSHSEKEHVY